MLSQMSAVTAAMVTADIAVKNNRTESYEVNSEGCEVIIKNARAQSYELDPPAGCDERKKYRAATSDQVYAANVAEMFLKEPAEVQAAFNDFTDNLMQDPAINRHCLWHAIRAYKNKNYDIKLQLSLAFIKKTLEYFEPTASTVVDVATPEQPAAAEAKPVPSEEPAADVVPTAAEEVVAPVIKKYRAHNYDTSDQTYAKELLAFFEKEPEHIKTAFNEFTDGLMLEPAINRFSLLDAISDYHYEIKSNAGYTLSMMFQDKAFNCRPYQACVIC